MITKKADISSFVKHCADEALNVFNLRVIQNGELVASYDWKENERVNIHSGTKSFTATAIGLAVNEGLMSLDEYVVDCFPEEIPEEPSENLKRMQLKHLITMTMGFKAPMLMGSQRPELRKQENDWVRYALHAEVVHRPGEKFLYNNAGPYLLGVLLTRRTGLSVTEYLKPRIFDPMGLKDVHTVEFCPKGYEMAAGGLMLNVDEYASLGQLYLQNGTWNNRQLVPREWIREATRLHSYAVPSVMAAPPHDNVIGAGYGYQIWIGPFEKWFNFIGSNENIVVVAPEKNAVIAITANVEDDRNNPVLHAIVQEIMPGL